MALPFLMLAAQAAPHVVRGVSALASRSGGAPPSSSAGVPQLDTEQKAAARVIAEVFREVKWPPGLAPARRALTLAAIVNAWHESRLRPAAWNPRGEDSVGLFQINRAGALGAPWSREQLRNPRTNALIIASEVVAQEQQLRAARTVAELTAAFTVHVERPANRHEVGRLRARTVGEWFGKSVSEAPVGS